MKGTTVALVSVIAVFLILIATGTFDSAPSAKPQTVGALVRLMRKGANSAYVATYEISNDAYFSPGTLTVANMPPAPGLKSRPNIDGYSSTLETSYVFRGVNGHIAQWIQDKTNVSACSNGPSLAGNTNLACSRPFPFIPSNGFVEESTGFLPTWQLNDFGPASPSYFSSIDSKSSRRFGELQCILLRQGVGAFRQTTCVNHRGLLVLWTTEKGSKLLGRAHLISLSYHPTAKNFITLEKPTKAMILPPF